MKIILSVLIAACILMPSWCWSNSPDGIRHPVFPTPLGYVNDYAALIGDDWHARIRNVCQELEDRTGVEMIVVTTANVNPYSHARDYAKKLYEAWHIGMTQQEHGIVLLVSLKERQAVIVLGRNVMPVIDKPQLDRLSEQHLIPMFQTIQFGESLYQTTVGLASAFGPITKQSTNTKRSSNAGLWMNVMVVVAMLFALWRFTRPDRRHPFQRWRNGEYWGTGQGGFGGHFGGFGGGTSGQGLS